VDVLVVPSLQVVGVGSAARAGALNAKASKGAAINPARVVIFMADHSLIWFGLEAGL
jgi:hypothetical protein